jgi:hypothetical protein
VRRKKGSWAVIAVACSLLSLAGGALFGYFDSETKYQAALKFNFSDHYSNYEVSPSGIGPQREFEQTILADGRTSHPVQPTGSNKQIKQ